MKICGALCIAVAEFVVTYYTALSCEAVCKCNKACFNSVQAT